MTLAIPLLWLEFLHDAATRLDDARALHPAFVLLMLLNLPVGVPVKLVLWGRLPILWFDALFVLAIGIFWYGVASWIQVQKVHKTFLPFKRKWMRVTVDLLLTSPGVFLAWTLVDAIRNDAQLSPSHFGGWLCFGPICAAWLLWVLGTLVIFGYDLVQCGRRNPTPQHLTLR